MGWHAAVMIAYDGREFTGSQRQPSKDTVEDECIRALKRVHAIDSEKESRFRAGSRTDTGVSALCNVIAFETGFKKRDRLLRALNAASETVYFYAYAEVGPEFSPRRAKQRWYRYFLPTEKKMDLDLMDRAAKEFVGKHDFKRFCRAEGKSTERTIDSITLTRLGDIVVIGANTGLRLDDAGEHVHQVLVAFSDQFAPRFGDGRAGLGAAGAAAVFFAGSFEGFTGDDAVIRQIPAQDFGGLG